MSRNPLIRAGVAKSENVNGQKFQQKNCDGQTCHFCFETFEVDLGIGETFTGHNSEIHDCVVCCNPNRIDYVASEGVVSSLVVGDGNE